MNPFRPSAIAGVLLAISLGLSATPIAAQQKPAAILPAEARREGWEEVDERMVFLTVRLATVEASLDAINKALGVNTQQQTARLADAKRAELGNELMDRKAGGPMAWSEFYGRTAEKFFYHPVDRNTTYHTTTVLRPLPANQDDKRGSGVPATHGLPVHQRPPQFDYIYRANREPQAHAEREATELRSKVDALRSRRQNLEAEQAALWCQIAFRAISHYDLARKPLYRFEPLLKDSEDESLRRAETVKGAAKFMCLALSIVEEADRDQATAFASINTVVRNGRKELDDHWLRHAVLGVEPTNPRTPADDFAALAKRLEDMADNLSDSYGGAVDGQRFQDEFQKNTYRGLLQRSLVDYAEIVLALDEMMSAMTREWRITPNVDKPFPAIARVSLNTPRRSSEFAPDGLPLSEPPAEPSKILIGPTIALFDGRDLEHWNFDASRWKVQDGVLVGEAPARLGSGGTFLSTKKQFKNYAVTFRYRVLHGNSGLYVGCRPGGSSGQKFDGIQADLGPGLEGVLPLFRGSSASASLASPVTSQLSQLRTRPGPSTIGTIIRSGAAAEPSIA